MNSFLRFRSSLLMLGLALLASRAFAAAAEPPTDWIDPDTGHRIVRLSKEPDTASLYFHQNAFSVGGDKMILTSPSGISVIDLATKEIKLIASGVAYSASASSGIEFGHKTRQVFYQKDGAIFATNVDTLATRELAKLPAGGSMSALNADDPRGRHSHGRSHASRPRRLAGARNRDACAGRPRAHVRRNARGSPQQSRR